MLGLSFSAKKVHAVAVAFVGSASAGCAVIGFSKDEKPHVLACTHGVLSLSAKTEPAAAVAIVKELSTQCAHTYSLSPLFKTYGPVRRSYGIIHAPWATSKSSWSETRFDIETTVTESLIRGLAEKALEKITSANPLFESSVVRVELNGYPTGKPHGKKAHQVSVAVLASYAETSVEQGLRDALTHTFPVPITLRSDAQSLLRIASDDIQRLHDCTVVHITDDATLCIVIRKGIPTNIEMIPFGTRTLAHSLGDTEDTMSLLRLATKELCETDACKTVAVALAKAEPELAKKYGEALSIISTARRVPDTIVLITHPDFSEWFASFLGRLDFAPFTVSTRPFQVLVPSTVQTHSSFVWNAGIKEEPSLIEAIMFVNREEGV